MKVKEYQKLHKAGSEFQIYQYLCIIEQSKGFRAPALPEQASSILESNNTKIQINPLFSNLAMGQPQNYIFKMDSKVTKEEKSFLQRKNANLKCIPVKQDLLQIPLVEHNKDLDSSDYQEAECLREFHPKINIKNKTPKQRLFQDQSKQQLPITVVSKAIVNPFLFPETLEQIGINDEKKSKNVQNSESPLTNYIKDRVPPTNSRCDQDLRSHLRNSTPICRGSGRKIGVIQHIKIEKSFGFLKIVNDPSIKKDIFFHLRDLQRQNTSIVELQQIKLSARHLSFYIRNYTSKNGERKQKAVQIRILDTYDYSTLTNAF